MVSHQPVTQLEFAAAVGVSQQAVSELVRAGVLPAGGNAQEWLLAYCQRLREQAAGRLGAEIGGLDLATERAALAREQRLGLEIKNATLRGEFAPVSLLSEVLATASQSVSERFEHLPGVLRKACPWIGQSEMDQISSTIASARNEWVRATEKLVVASVDVPDDADELAEQPELQGSADE